MAQSTASVDAGPRRLESSGKVAGADEVELSSSRRGMPSFQVAIAWIAAFLDSHMRISFD